MNLAEHDVIRLQEFINRVVQQSYAYRNLTGQDLAPTAWTPALTFATPGDLAVTYTTQVGYWSKHGRRVFVDFFIVTSAFTHTTASGALTIGGLPFTSANITDNRYTGSTSWGGITKATYTQVVPRVQENTTNIVFTASGSGVASSAVAAADVPTGGTVNLRGSIVYEAAV